MHKVYSPAYQNILFQHAQSLIAMDNGANLWQDPNLVPFCEFVQMHFLPFASNAQFIEAGVKDAANV